MSRVLIRFSVSVGVPCFVLWLFGLWPGVIAALIVLILWAYGLITWWEETS